MANGDGADQRGRFLPGMDSTVRSRSTIPEDVTGTSPIPSLAAPSGLPLKGEAFVSDVHTKPPAFMTLYEQGLATAEQADNAVEAWHESGDDEQRSLSEYLGMSETEYDVWCMAPDALPIILRARREPTPLRDLLAAYLAELRLAADPGDRSVVFALGNWLEKPASSQA
jgi:hypothetical protein